MYLSFCSIRCAVYLQLVVCGSYSLAYRLYVGLSMTLHGTNKYNPPAKYVIGQLVNPLANGSLFVHGSTHSQITLNTDPLTKSARDLSVKARVLPHKANQ